MRFKSKASAGPRKGTLKARPVPRPIPLVRKELRRLRMAVRRAVGGLRDGGSDVPRAQNAMDTPKEERRGPENDRRAPARERRTEPRNRDNSSGRGRRKFDSRLPLGI